MNINQFILNQYFIICETYNYKAVFYIIKFRNITSQTANHVIILTRYYNTLNYISG